LRRPFALLAMHFTLPALHLLCVGGGGGRSTAATNAATHESTLASAEAVSSNVTQSLPALLSSFSKQPFDGVAPPSNLALAFVTHEFAFGSFGLPGVRASWLHLRSPPALFAMHLSLLAAHLLCTAFAGAVASSAIMATPRLRPIVLER
jgi:hypothetical protein